MKCSKCGEECNENQAVCLKCGNPIQIVPDLNLIEEELANNVGEMIEEIQQEQKTKELFQTARHIYDYDVSQPTNEYKTIDDTLENFKPIQLDDDLEEEIKLANIERQNKKAQANKQGYTVDSATTYKKHKKSEEEMLEHHEKKMLRFKITSAIVAIFVILIVAVAIIFWPSGGKSTSSFKKHYDKGLSYYNSGDFQGAANEYKLAYDSTNDEKSMKKVLTSLWDTYKKIGDSDENIIDVLKKLIAIEPDKVDYYESLLEIYDKKGMIAEMDELIHSVEGTDIASQLVGYSFTGPEFNYESGDYEQFLYITLRNNDGYKMYYTVDGSDPTTTSTEYTEPFEISNEGETIVKAISVNEKGVTSSIVEKKFNITLSTLTAPVVNPDSGTYTACTQISVQVPDGMKAYYTFSDDGKIPDTSSEEYKEPIDMPTGKSLFSVILVNDQGVSSTVTQKLYELNVDRTYTYNQALDSLKTNLISRAIIMDNDGNTSNGGKVEFSYVGVQVIDSNEYYLIKTTTGDVYGVGTVTGVIAIIAVNAEGVYEIAG